MSIPTLCQACYKHYRSTVVNACPFCDDVQFPEQVLCDLVREGQGEKQLVDLRLVGGSALFGVGWGLAGICPGPALTNLVTLEPKVLVFVAAMLIGMIAALWRDKMRPMESVGHLGERI